MIHCNLSHYIRKGKRLYCHERHSRLVSISHGITAIIRSLIFFQNINPFAICHHQIPVVLLDLKSTIPSSFIIPTTQPVFLFHRFFLVTALSVLPNSVWIIDSGATNHMCYSLNLFASYKARNTPFSVQLPDGSDAPIAHIGTVHLSPTLTLHNVFHIPSFKFNLISVSQLTKTQNCSLTLLSTSCSFQDLSTRKTIGQGSIHDGLYFFKASSTSLAVLKPPTIDIWHWRLGHVPFRSLESMAKKFSSISCSNNHFCEICPQAKQTRLPFPSSAINTTRLFQLIHVDIWGPFSQPSSNGSRYFLTIVDDYSRCTWVFLMHVKSETQRLLQYFFAMVKTQFRSKIETFSSGNGEHIFPEIQKFQSDNGSEFLSKEMQIFFLSNGIVHQRSCIGTPQQNGVVERKHRHILEVARALRFQAHLPLKFWGECVLTSVYLINKMPTPLLSGKTPHDFLIPHLAMTTCVFLVAYVMLIMHISNTNLISGLLLGYLLGTHTLRKDIVFMTLKHILSSHLVMSPFMKKYFHSKTSLPSIFLPIILQTPLSLHFH